MKAFSTIDVSAPEWAWPHIRPSFFGYGRTAAHHPSDDLSRAAFEAGGSWIYVFKGQVSFKYGKSLHVISEGNCVLFTNPVMATLVYPKPVTMIRVAFYGSPTTRFLDWLITRYGSFHRIKKNAPVILKALELYHSAETQSRHPAHAWSVRLYEWALLLWREMESRKASTLKKTCVIGNSQLLGMSYPNFQSFAKAMGYDPAYLSRTLEKSWDHKSPAKILRMGRLQKAENLLRTSNLSVRKIAKEICYSGPDAFAAAFRRVYGMAPLRYRHIYRLGLSRPNHSL